VTTFRGSADRAGVWAPKNAIAKTTKIPTEKNRRHLFAFFMKTSRMDKKFPLAGRCLCANRPVAGFMIPVTR
jgi:hypothetical protein